LIIICSYSCLCKQIHWRCILWGSWYHKT